MTHTIDPQILYSQSPFFLDFIDEKNSATQFFQHSAMSVHRLAEERQTIPSQRVRSELCDSLMEYNQVLDAPSAAIANIDQLRNPKTLCVIGGQQAGFLGGPLFVIYKIVSIIRSAARLSDHLNVPVVPIFWLASEDHDFAEINHTRWLDDSGALRTVSFDWDGQGHPIEQLSITEPVRNAFDEANKKIAFSKTPNAAIFSPAPDDDYCTWHARMWSRLFAEYGLILVEPRVLRTLAEPFFKRALAEQRQIQASLALSASRLGKLGYPALLDLERSGELFRIDKDGFRHRVDDSSEGANLHDSVDYSADAAIRPVNILGGAHDDRLHHVALLDLAARNGLLDGDDDDIANVSVFAL